MKNILSEGRYDQVTTDISRGIVTAIKQGRLRYETRITLYTRTFVDFSVYIHYSDDKEPQVYGATYLQPKDIRKHFRDKRIVLHVDVPKNQQTRNQELSNLVPEIKNIVRHEIEHINQHKFKDRQRENLFSNKRRYPQDLEFWEYLVEPYEVEAYVRGLYRKAKTLRQPLNVVFQSWWDYLEDIELHPDEIQTIKSAWTEYAKKHLPRTPLRQYGYEDTEAHLNLNQPAEEVVTESMLFEAKKDTLRSKYTQIPPEFFDRIVDGDPSTTKKYSEWMLKEYTKVMIPAEIDRIIDVVTRFDQSAGRINHEFVRKGIDTFESKIGMDIPAQDIDTIMRSPKDINSYGNIGLLNSILDQIQSKKTKREEKLVGADKIFEDENFLVVLPKTPEGSCHYGSGTKWCTAAKGSNQFNNYSSRGTLYYIIFKANSVLDPERRKKPVWQRRLPLFEKIARFIPNGQKYGTHGEFYNAQDASMSEDEILNQFLGVTWRELSNLKEYVKDIPKGMQPIYDSWEKAWTAIDTHYAKNGMSKANNHGGDWDDGFDDEDMDDDDEGYDDFDMNLDDLY